MSRLTLPRFALRRRLRRQSRKAQDPVRSLALEQLDSRIVLSGMAEISSLDAGAEITTSVQPPVSEVSTNPSGSSEGVTVPIQVIEPAAIDAAFASSATDSSPSQTLVLPGTSTPPPPSNPGGEAPGDTSTTPPIAPPVISNFQTIESEGYWQISGTVTDDKSVTGLTVTFGGLLSGHTATVNSQGAFSITLPFPPATNGAVTAVTTDTDGLQSNSVFTWISN